MPTGEAAQAASTLTPALPAPAARLALPAPSFYAAAFDALVGAEARSRQRMPRSATWVGSGATLRRLPAPLLPYLPERERRLRIARASSAVAQQTAPRYTIVDCHGRGAAAYRHDSAGAAAPMFTPLQAALLDGIRRMRRWRYYDAPALPAPAASMPLDGCLCRVCLLR